MTKQPHDDARSLNEIAFIEAEALLKELGAIRWRAREVAAVVRREEGPEEIAVAIEEAINVVRSASSRVSSLVYASFAAHVEADPVQVEPHVPL